MNVLNNEIKNKIKKFYNQKNYSKLENLLEKLENFDELPVSFLMIYAVSKALNPKSKISDYKISAHYFEKIYRNNEKNLEPLYNLIIVSLKAKRFLNLNNILENVYLSNKKDLITYVHNDFLNLLNQSTLKSEDAIIFSNNVTWQKQVTKALFDNTKGHLFVMNPCGIPYTQSSTINTSWRKEKQSTIYKLNTNTNR